MSREQRDQDLKDLREAVDKFLLAYKDTTDTNTDQINLLVSALEDIKVDGTLKSEEDYAEYFNTSEDYYQSENW